MKSESPELTTTSYAVLSLLELQPWTTYELAQQMKRSLHWFWPRAESKLYQEPKKLVAHGLARSTERFQGRRRSTVYAITPAGRRALAAWAREPGEATPVMEFEALVRVLSSQVVDVDDLRRTIESVRDSIEESIAFGERQGVEIATTGGPFPDRTHIISLVHSFMYLHFDAVHRWATWALEEIDRWDTTAGSKAKQKRAQAMLLTPVGEFSERAGR